MASRVIACLATALLAVACSGDERAAEPVEADMGRPAIAPSDFVLLPCETVSARPCVIVMAGGKWLMFGAPAGAGRNAMEGDMSGLEALFLFSMHPEDVEGVDEVRNRGWREGRGVPLPVSGPDGTSVLIEGLNAAFEQPDAISFVEDGAPKGGFSSALLTLGAEVTGDVLIYDSGDLKVQAASGGSGRVTYRIGYRDLSEDWHDVILRPCGGGAVSPGDHSEPTGAEIEIGCAANDMPEGSAWPLKAPVFVKETQS